MHNVGEAETLLQGRTVFRLTCKAGMPPSSLGRLAGGPACGEQWLRLLVLKVSGTFD